ncbi:ATPase, partial [Listeria monocytogenes]|nr:ATPase [Listeria monocytogenes]
MNEAIERRDDDMTIVSFEVEISAPIQEVFALLTTNTGLAK